MKSRTSNTALVKRNREIVTLQERMKNMRKKGEHKIRNMIDAVETGGAAFAFGFAEGRWTDWTKLDAKGNPDTLSVAGLPVSLAGAVAFHGAALFMGGKYGDDLHALGNGALSTYLANMGRGIGNHTNPTIPKEKK